MTDVAEFYDAFNSRLVRDFLYGNRRVAAQRKFFLRLLDDVQIKTVLVVGCGIGDVSADLAQVLEARGGRVLAVDISEKNIVTAQRLFQRDNLLFECRDISKAPPQDLVWDLILFPDVYEHIPTAARAALHTTLNRILAPGGAVALTCPTVQQQRALRATGEGLQVVDEEVSAEDVLQLTHDLQAYLVHFSYRTVFFQHDYFHALIRRIPGTADLQAYPPQPGCLHRLCLRVYVRLRALFRLRFLKSRGIAPKPL